MKMKIFSGFLCLFILFTGVRASAIEANLEITGLSTQEALTITPNLLQNLEGMTEEEFAQIPLIDDTAADEEAEVTAGPLRVQANNTTSLHQNSVPMIDCHRTQAIYLNAEGKVYTWGDDDALPSSIVTPTIIEEIDSIIKVAVGNYDFVALRSDGTVWLWGNSATYGIGNSLEPTQVTGLSHITDIAIGYTHCLALSNGGTVYAWGDNDKKQLGVDSPNKASTPVQVPSLQSVIAVAAGNNHSVAVTSDGSVWTWGDNTYGQLGDGTTTSHTLPAIVSGIEDVIAISARGDHTMALKADGTVWTWGYNTYGQIGNGTTTQQTTPVQVSGLSNIVQISAGIYGSAAVDTEGQLWTWGKNDYGQLGTGDTLDRTTPVCVSSIGAILFVSMGEDATIVLKEDGSLWAVGNNQHFFFGVGKGWYGLTPQRVLSIDDVQSASAGFNFSILLKEDGTVWTYGDNNAGQLGVPGALNTSIPIQVYEADGQTPLSDVKQVAACDTTAYILKENGTVWAWGNNYYGELGTGSSEFQSNVPVQVKGENGEGYLTNVIKLIAYDMTCIAIKADGTLWGWGENRSDLLGDDTYEYCVKTPIQFEVTNVVDATQNGEGVLAVKSDGTFWWKGNDSYGQLSGISSLTSVASFSLGNGYCMALKTDGSVWGVGNNSYHNLGPGNSSYTTPQQILSAEENIIAIEAGDNSLALKSDGTPLSWGGYNFNGALGNGSTYSTQAPTPILGPNGIGTLSNIKFISCSEDHSIAIDNDGIAWTWGSNSDGQLADGVYVRSSLEWIRVHTPTSGSIASASGTYHTVILNSDGTVWAAGRNQYGQLGIGTTTDSSEAVQINNLGAVIAVAAGDNHTLALKNDGSVWAWGKNTYGQLGNQSSANASAPVQVLDDDGEAYLEDVIAIAANADYSLALKADGTLWSWGLNDQGQLGDGTVNSHNLPTQVKGVDGTGYLTDITDMAAGEKHAIAVKSDGTVWTWGDNQYWQLGDHSDMESYTPVQVTGSNGTGTLTDVVAVAAGRDASYALKADGTVWAWGYNAFGQIGDGSTTHAETPTQVKGENGNGFLTDVADISANMATVYAKKSDGTVWVWGNNEFGQFGDTTTTNSSTPVQVYDTDGLSGMEDIRYVSAGDHMVILIKGDGKIYASGYNRYGEFGIDTNNNRTSVPVRAFTKYILYDDYGNDFINATEILVNRTILGEINYATDVDCFKFSVPFEDGYLFKSTGIIVPTIYNENYEPICTFGPTAFHLVPNKTYYIKVTGPVNAYSYTIIQPTNTLYIADASLLEGTTGETELEHLQTGYVRAKINIINEYIVNKRVSVLVALVKKSTNAYVNHTVVDKMLGGGGSEYMTVGFNVPGSGQDYKIVIQLWDSMLTMNLLGSEWVLQ
ncbi:RCC1 domain-containing protein [Ructibacterium gallinarum]|uniref:RCC1-like domain-containing protein n=1 Tax=Ructibacterium gallinarum TaxID=2779355 RepID=A0A9D5M2Q4_9FIRM|nr:hypothetical protein [Ructibacterium gallinarum]MBE5041046.1 hypothetical protein [Ructibacterium gallinarum]